MLHVYHHDCLTQTLSLDRITVPSGRIQDSSTCAAFLRMFLVLVLIHDHDTRKHSPGVFIGYLKHWRKVSKYETQTNDNREMTTRVFSCILSSPISSTQFGLYASALAVILDSFFCETIRKIEILPTFVLAQIVYSSSYVAICPYYVCIWALIVGEEFHKTVSFILILS